MKKTYKRAEIMKRCIYFIDVIAFVLILSATSYPCLKLDVIEILDEGLAPSMRVLKDQSKQDYQSFALVYVSSLFLLEGLPSVLDDIQKQYNTPPVKIAIATLNTHLEKANNIITSFIDKENAITFGPLCIELEAIQKNLLTLLGLLND